MAGKTAPGVVPPAAAEPPAAKAAPAKGAPAQAAPAGPTSSSPAPAKTASAPAPPTDTASAPAPAGWHDGTYVGYGASRHGDVESTVVIEQGKIVAAAISRCLTQYSCSWIAHLQPQVVARQSPDVDNVSGATHSANAFYYSVVDALAKAK